MSQGAHDPSLSLIRCTKAARVALYQAHSNANHCNSNHCQAMKKNLGEIEGDDPAATPEAW